MARRIEIFTTKTCPYCVAAKRLLDRLGAPYEEIDVTGDARAREQLVDRAEGRRTVPQIFVDGAPVGGYTDLAEKLESGELKL